MNIGVFSLRKNFVYSDYFKEAWVVFLAAFPLILIQFANFSKGFADMIMVGQIDEINLAALAIAGSIFGVMGMFTGGFISSTITVLSKLHAEQDYKQMHYWGQQAFYLNTILTILVAILIYNTGYFISFLDLTDQTIKIASDYLKIMAIAFPFFSTLNIFRPIMQTFLKNKQLMYLLVSMSILNVPLNYLFIYYFNMGGVGAAYATVICFLVEVIVLYFYIRPNPQMNIFKNFNKPNIEDMLSLFKLGYTVGLSIMIELGLGAIIITLLAKYGETVISGHQVVLNYSNIIFAVALGFRFAIIRKTSFLLGLQQIENIKKMIIGSLIFSAIIGVIFIVLMLVFTNQIISIYTSEDNVKSIAYSLLYISLFHQFFNIMLTTAIGVLRGLKLNNVACYITFWCYLIVGLGLGWLLSLQYGLTGFWIGLVLCLLAMNVVSYYKIYKIIWKDSSLFAKLAK